MLNKKGQSLSINTIIILILAVFVLVVVVVALTGGYGNFVKWYQNIAGSRGISVESAVLTCNGYCTSFQASGLESIRENYCEKIIELDLDGDKVVDEEMTCDDLRREGGQVQCDEIEC